MPLCRSRYNGMMAQRSMAKIRQHDFRLVEPLVDGEVVFGDTAELSRTVLRALQRMGHDSNLPRVRRIADDFIPVVLDANLARLNVESNRSMSALAVLISFGCKTFEQVTELADIEVIRQARVIDWVVCGVLELRRFCTSFVAISVVADRYRCYASSSQLVREFEHFHFPILILRHDEFSFFVGVRRPQGTAIDYRRSGINRYVYSPWPLPDGWNSAALCASFTCI